MSASGFLDDRFFANLSVGVDELKAGALAASAAGRAKMADDFFDLPATMQAKFSPNVFDAATVADLFAADSIDSDQYVAGSVDGEHLSTDAKQSVLQSKFIAGWLQFTTTSGTIATKDVNSPLTAAATVDTPQNTVSAKGVLTSNSGSITNVGADPDNYKVQIRTSSDNEPVDDGAGGEVYGVLSQQGGSTFQVNYYKADDTAYTPPSNVNYDFLVAEIYDLDDLPGTALLQGPSFGDISSTTQSHTHTLSEITDVSTTEAELDQALDGISANVTAANLSELTGAGTTTLHNHDSRYFTETEIGAVGSGNPNSTSGAALIGTDASAIGDDAGTTDTVQGVLEAFQTAIDNLQSASSSSGTPRQEEVTTQNITTNGVAMTDVLDNTPISNASVKIYLQGILMRQGTHYTISGTTITWNGATFEQKTTDIMTAVYES